jgi:ribosomal protein S27E
VGEPSGIEALELEGRPEMITIECPFCDEPVRMDDHADAVRCESCAVELEFAPDGAAPVIAIAA